MSKITTMPAAEDVERLTPAMRQFVDIKKDYPDTLVLFRMGDFYETFFDDAIKINRLIGITLTKRGKKPNGDPIPMAGLPMVSLDQYVARLVKMGESLVIAEQLGTPGQGLMERKISRIITPGTLTDETLLPQKEDSVLLAMSGALGKMGDRALVWLTLSNGQFFATHTTTIQLDSELARIAPSEILCAEEEKQALRERFPDFTFTALPDWHFDAQRGTERLKKFFHLETLEPWGIENDRLVLKAANALLDYTEQTQVDMLPFIAPLKLYKEQEHIVIDAATRRNLEITESLRGDAQALTLLSTLDRCRTGMGSRELRRRLQEPLRDKAEVNQRLDMIETLNLDRDLQAHLDALLRTLPDVERIASRISLKSVRPKELAALRDALPAMSNFGKMLVQYYPELFYQAGHAIDLPPSLFEKLDAMLLEDPATLLRDGDVIRSEAHPDFAQLRELRDHHQDFLVKLETKERERSGLASLRVDFNKIQGFFIEIPKSQAQEVPLTYQRLQTLKNVERFTTPELKDHENRVLSAKEKAAQLEKALWDELIHWLNPFIEPLMTAAHEIAGLDTLLALAEHASLHQWVRPSLSEKSTIEIDGGRHPVVESVLETYVPNDCHMGDGRRCLVITGPNMGGKSTYMRSVALIALLAWAGSFVPAKSAVIGAIDRIHTRIGASDDLARGRSTFMVEMTEAAAILHQATHYSLVLMDEIGRGTATFDGLSLAGAIAQELVEKTRSLTLFATHYFELTQLAANLSEAANVHVSAVQNKNNIVFMHEIQEGPASHSYGIAVAQLAGVPSSVLRRAKQMMQKLEVREQMNTSPQAELFGSAFDFFEDTAPSQHENNDALVTKIDDAKAFARAITDVDLDQLTPREALAELYDLREQAKALVKALNE